MVSSHIHKEKLVILPRIGGTHLKISIGGCYSIVDLGTESRAVLKIHAVDG